MLERPLTVMLDGSFTVYGVLYTPSAMLTKETSEQRQLSSMQSEPNSDITDCALSVWHPSIFPRYATESRDATCDLLPEISSLNIEYKKVTLSLV
jgi:hypothetical protein